MYDIIINNFRDLYSYKILIWTTRIQNWSLIVKNYILKNIIYEIKILTIRIYCTSMEIFSSVVKLNFFFKFILSFKHNNLNLFILISVQFKYSYLLFYTSYNDSISNNCLIRVINYINYNCFCISMTILIKKCISF